MSGAAVRFRNVDIIFGERAEEALQLLDRGATRNEILEKTGAILGAAGASLDVGEGEICVLMGLSGSGKSTLLRAVNGLNRPIRGEVLVRDGERVIDVARCDEAALRRLRMTRIAMVFQQFALLPWRTVEENVGFGLELAGVPAQERAERVKKQLKLVNLDQWAGKYAQELSGGMQQRVGLARAFATEAPILLMDEPFSALDPLIRTHLQDELLDLQKTLKRTIVFVSHDLDEALKIGTHIAILEGGRIVQVGAPQDIVLSPASGYVAEFVAHMNPLNVLDGASLMTKVADLPRVPDGVMLDAARKLSVRLGAGGKAEEVRLEDRLLKIAQIDALERAEPPLGSTVVVAPAATPIRAIIEARQRSGLPVLLIEGTTTVGVVRDEEIYAGLLRRQS